MSNELLSGFRESLEEQDMDDVVDLVRHAGRFLTWRADAPIESLDEDDVRSFLLDWCPRQPAMPAKVAGDMCEAIVEFTLFLGHTWRLRGGPQQGRILARLANTLESAVRAAILAQDLSDADSATLTFVMNSVPKEQHSTVLAAWKPALPASERAGLVAAWITDSTDARTRLVGLTLLDMFETNVAEPYMRQLLDTAAAGHAAIWLLDNALADGGAVGAFITPAIVVDILSQLVDHPDVLCEQFICGYDPDRMLEFFWRHPAPETAAVLDVLARHLRDPVLAKAARRAGFRHRAWMAHPSRSA